jgi:hypothetical protein
MEMTGAVAWLELWQVRRISRPTRGNVSAVFLFSLVTLGLMLRAANLGGDIRHPEIRFDQETTPTAAAAGSGTEWLRSASVKAFVLEHPWVWPACETVHFIGLSLSFGVLLLANLRLLGMMKDVSFSALHRLLPGEFWDSASIYHGHAVLHRGSRNKYPKRRVPLEDGV